MRVFLFLLFLFFFAVCIDDNFLVLSFFSVTIFVTRLEITEIQLVALMYCFMFVYTK